MTSWFFGSRHDETVTHGRILDAVEDCRNSVNECARSIAVIHEHLNTGGDRFVRIEKELQDLGQRMKGLEQVKAADNAVATVVKNYFFPLALALLGLAFGIYQSAMWMGDRLDGDNSTHIEQ